MRLVARCSLSFSKPAFLGARYCFFVFLFFFVAGVQAGVCAPASSCLHRCVRSFLLKPARAYLPMCACMSKIAPFAANVNARHCNLPSPQNVLQSIIHPKQCTLQFCLTQTTVQDKKCLHAKESHIKWDSGSYCSLSENYFVHCCSNRALASV